MVGVTDDRKPAFIHTFTHCNTNYIVVIIIAFDIAVRWSVALSQYNLDLRCQLSVIRHGSVLEGSHAGPQVGKSSTSLLPGVKAGRVHLCRVVGRLTL